MDQQHSQQQSEQQSEQQKQPINNTKLFIIIFSIIIPLVGFAILISNYSINLKNHSADYSDLNIELIDSNYISDLSGKEELRLGVSNQSKDAKSITKALLKIHELREDDSFHINIVSMDISNTEKTVLKAYNDGWQEIHNVIIRVTPDSDFFYDLKEPNKFKIELDIMEPGVLYEIGTLTSDDLRSGTIPFPLKFSYKAEGNVSSFSCGGTYTYNDVFGKITVPFKGGPTEIYSVFYCLDVGNGAMDYEIPISYNCPAHGYEEIKFAICSNKSCHIRYSIELYSNQKLLFKTEEKGVFIQTDSYNGPPEGFE